MATWLARRNIKGGAALMAVVLLALLAVLAFQACSPAPDRGAEPGLRRGQPAPDFSATDLSGNRLTLSAMRGKAVVINFWATTCPPCREEMPEIEAVFQKYKDQAVFIGVAPSDTESTVREFLKGRRLSWNFVMDPQGRVSFPYEVYLFPTTYYIDKQGVVASVHIGGPVSRQNIEAALRDALKGV